MSFGKSVFFQRILIRASLLALCFLGAAAWAEDGDSRSYLTRSFFPTKGPSLPPFIFGDTGFQSSEAKPIESSFRLGFAERTLMFRTSYLEKKISQDPLAAGNERRGILSVLASTDLYGSLLKSESEFAYNPWTPGTMEGFGEDLPKLFRFGVTGNWQGSSYGAEFHSWDKGFMNLKGHRAWRSENKVRALAGHRFGPIGVQADFSRLWENLDEDSQRPRVTDSVRGSFDYWRSGWLAKLSSGYSMERDRFAGGRSAEVMSHELQSSYQPAAGLKISPKFQYRREWNRASGVVAEKPSLSLNLACDSRRDTLKLNGFTSYAWPLSSDDVTRQRELTSGAKLVWNLGNSFPGRSKLFLEVSYKRHLDLIAHEGSEDQISAKFLLTIMAF